MNEKIIQSTFAGGEIDPILYGRYTLSQYQNSLATSYNTHHHLQGALSNRAGSLRRGKIHSGNDPQKTIIHTFRFNNNQQYLVEIGKYIQIWSSDGVTLLYTFSQAHNLDDIAHGLKFNQVGDILYIFHVGIWPLKLIRISDGNWKIEKMWQDCYCCPPMTPYNTNLDKTITVTTGLEGSVNFTVSDSLNLDDITKHTYIKILFNVDSKLEHMSYSQGGSANLIYTSPHILLRKGTKINISTTGMWFATLEIIKNEGNINISTVGKYVSNGDKNFNLTFTFSSNCKIWVKVTNWIGGSGRNINLNIQAEAFQWEQMFRYKIRQQPSLAPPGFYPDNPDFHYYKFNTKEYQWAVGECDYANNFPYIGGIYKDRQVLAYLSEGLFKIAFSEIGAYDNFDYNVLTSSSPILITTPLSMGIVKNIIAANQLIVILASGVISIDGYNGYLSPTTVTIMEQNNNNSRTGSAIKIENRIIYECAKHLHDLVYDYNQDGFYGEDITLLSNHLFAQKEMTDMYYNPEDNNAIYIVLSDGSIIVCNYLRMQQFIAFSKREYSFKILCADLCRHKTEQYLYALGEDGYIRRLLNRTVTSENFLDDSVEIEAEEEFTEIDISAYQGKNIALYYNGDCEFIDNAGTSHTLKVPAKKVIAGIPYTTIAVLLPPVFNANMYLNKTKFFNLFIDLMYSRGVSVGTKNGGMKELPYNEISDMTTEKKFYDGIYETFLDCSIKRQNAVVIEQKYPLPFTVKSVTVGMMAGKI